MTTVSALIEQTRQRLRPGRRDQLNRLSGAITNASTSIVFASDRGLSENARYSIDLEDILGWETSTSTKTVTTVASPNGRGFNGSTATSHTDGTIVYVDPEFSTFDIFRAFNEVLSILPGRGVFNLPTPITLTGNSSKTGYNLTGVATLNDVHKVLAKRSDGRSNWVPIPRTMWSVQQDMATSDFAAGEALFIRGGYESGQSIRVIYSTPFTQLAALTDDVETVSGLRSSMHSLLIVGAALRLIQGRPLERAATDAQGATRRPAEVTTNDTRLSMTPLQLEWQELIKGAKKETSRRMKAL